MRNRARPDGRGRYVWSEVTLPFQRTAAKVGAQTCPVCGVPVPSAASLQLGGYCSLVCEDMDVASYNGELAGQVEP